MHRVAPDLDFLNMAQKFYADLEQLMLRTNQGVLDSVMHYIEVNRIEPEIIGQYIAANQVLKAKMLGECEDLRLVKRVPRLAI
jgi:hypothetical protein